MKYHLKLVIDEFNGNYLAPERLQMLKKIATIESIGSSTRIEGAKDRYPNLIHAHFVLGEIAGYAYMCEQNFETMPFTIKQFHIWLLQFSYKDTSC